jgi:hypothetical protein
LTLRLRLEGPRKRVKRSRRVMKRRVWGARRRWRGLDLISWKNSKYGACLSSNNTEHHRTSIVHIFFFSFFIINQHQNILTFYITSIIFFFFLKIMCFQNHRTLGLQEKEQKIEEKYDRSMISTRHWTLVTKI